MRAHELEVGGDAISELLGGTPVELAERYQSASPHALLPLGVPQLLIHGTEDDVAPIEFIKPRHRSENAHWECWLRDPEGYTIVLASPHGSAE
jgi:hypothetical protein